MLSEIKFEKTAVEALKDKQLYIPLEITPSQFQPKAAENAKGRPDALIRVKWQGKEVSFIAEIRSRSAPQMAQQAIWQLKNFSKENNNLLLVVPYLSKTIAEMVTNEKISAIDLNGNYFIQTKDFLAIRLDRINQYKESQPIKKIFSGNSSLIGRLLLTQKEPFYSLDQISQAIAQRGGNVSLSTISKVLKGLEEELIIQRENKQIRLIQADKLLESLRGEYLPPKIQHTLKLNVPGLTAEFINDFANGKWVLTGESSASQYTITTPSKVFSAYVTDFKNVPRDADDRFPTMILKKTEEPFVYFDIQKKGKVNFSSKLQSYLELSQLDKREKEIAQSIQKDILGAFQ